MTNGTTTLNIWQHIILRNYWEYYVTDQKHGKNIYTCLVLGEETEIGDVDFDEIRPYVISATTKLGRGVMAAPNWKWTR